MLVLDYEWIGQVFVALLVPSVLIFVGYQAREFHRRGMERVGRSGRVMANQENCLICSSPYEANGLIVCDKCNDWQGE